MVNAEKTALRKRSLLRSLWLVVPVAAAIVPLATGQPQAAPSQEGAAQGALVKQYCAGCHNDKLKTASLSLQGLDLSKASGDADIWPAPSHSGSQKGIHHLPRNRTRPRSGRPSESGPAHDSSPEPLRIQQRHPRSSRPRHQTRLESAARRQRLRLRQYRRRPFAFACPD